MDWETYRDIWPNAAHSHFVSSRPHSWHVQMAGSGEAVLLLHGAGGATHSWRDLFPELAKDWHVLAPDLPGHGFTRLGALQRSGLTLMARDLATLLAVLEVQPSAIIGHSAGAALALELAMILPKRPRAIVTVNAALEDFRGVAGWLFPAMAKMLALNPFTAPTFATMARKGDVGKLIQSTGSEIDPVGAALYRACIGDARHVDGAITMMSQWHLSGLQSRLPDIAVPTLLLTGRKDQTVPPDGSRRAALRLPAGTHQCLGDLGHLAHEEAPEMVLAAIREHLAPAPQRQAG